MNEFKPNQKMLQDYIQNKLSAADTEAVELWLINNPRVMQDLEMDLMLKQGLEEMQLEPAENDYPLHLPVSSFRRRFVMAAAFIGVFFMGGITMHLFDNHSENTFSEPNILMLSTNRGTAVDAHFDRTKNTVIQIPAGYLSDDHYSIELLDQSQNSFYINNVAVKDDLLTVFIPKNLLATGSYQLEATNLTTQQSEIFYLEAK